jgi:hypothetical protein
MVASITRVQSPPNSLVKQVLICHRFSKYFKYATFSKYPLAISMSDFALHSDDELRKTTKNSAVTGAIPAETRNIAFSAMPTHTMHHIAIFRPHEESKINCQTTRTFRFGVAETT